MTAPVWTQTTGAARACNACHGAPPPAPHSTSTACGSCHTGYTATTVNATTHMNGVLDVTGMTCTSCHGTSGQTATQAAPLYAAPPRGTKAETATTTRAVGAHQAHLTGTRLRSAAIACTQCHAVPAATSHANSVVELAWGTLATKSGAVGRDLERHGPHLHQLLPRHRRLRRHDEEPDLDRRRIAGEHLHLLPRRPAPGPAHHEHGLRRLPRGLHRHHRQPRHPHERGGRRDGDDLHLLPRHGDPRRHHAEPAARRGAPVDTTGATATTGAAWAPT